MSTPIVAKLPWQKQIPLLGLGTSFTNRSKFSTEFMMRALPKSFGSGGSSGCIAKTTPAFSAKGTNSVSKRSKFFHNSDSEMPSPACVGRAAVAS
jgi:hypothetical protein